MRHYKKLVGEKIYLSPSSIEDAKKFAIWINDFRVSDTLGCSELITTVEKEEDFIKDQKRKYCFSVVRLDNDEVIGQCWLNNPDEVKRTTTLGIFIGEELQRGCGFGQEAVGLLVEFGFRYLNLHNIMLFVFEMNKIGISCYQKVGFKEFARRRESYYVNGNYYDTVLMDIVSKEFKAGYIKNRYI